MFPLKDNVRTRMFPLINDALIAINIAVFVYELHLSGVHGLEPFLTRFSLVPHRFFAAPATQWTTIFTAMFLHGSWEHVLGNMWFLTIFGRSVEDRLGHARYLLFYLLMGVGAASAQIYMNPASRLPMLGASGAIAGVLGGYFLMFPRARVLTFFIFIFIIRLIEIPAFFVLGLWFVLQMFSGVGSLAAGAMRGETGGVAWWAHTGGFAAGFLFVTVFRRRRSSS